MSAIKLSSANCAMIAQKIEKFLDGLYAQSSRYEGGSHTLAVNQKFDHIHCVNSGLNLHDTSGCFCINIGDIVIIEGHQITIQGITESGCHFGWIFRRQ